MGAKAKILGQAKPGPAAMTDLYTVPAATEAQGLLTCCNQAATDDKVRVALAKAGEGIAAKHYVCYDTVVPANGILEKAFDLGAGDVLKVYSTAGSSSFTATGLEVT